jgi:hypothetical protein
VVLGKVCYQLADEFERSLQVHPDTPVRWVFPNPLPQLVCLLNTKTSTTAATAP